MSDSKTKHPDWVDPEEAKELRDKHYNATIIERIDVHENLARFRVRPDTPQAKFEPGQYVTLGLGNWEPRLADTEHESLDPKKFRKVVQRAYSISCPILHDDGSLAPVNDLDYLEFYITLVRQAGEPGQAPPALTPRLFLKNAGDRIKIGKKIVGHYTLGEVSPHETVLLLGTGTGEAPHNAMIAQLLSRGHQGRIACVTSVRFLGDIAYRDQHKQLMKQFKQYRYLPLTTREPENTDVSHSHYVGKQYIQELFVGGRLGNMISAEIDPSNTHVYLCGNPSMIGYVPPGAPEPTNPGMLTLLKNAGFHDVHENDGPGGIRFEKYW